MRRKRIKLSSIFTDNPTELQLAHTFTKVGLRSLYIQLAKKPYVSPRLTKLDYAKLILQEVK